MEPAELIARIRAILGDRVDVSEMEMMGGHQFMVGGSIACSVRKGTLTVRVEPGRMEALLREPGARPMVLGARTMRGFLRVDESSVRTEAQLRRWVALGVDAATNRPNPPGRRAARSRSAPRHRPR